MGGVEKRDADTYDQRDERITQLLLSSDEAVRKEGMILLDGTLRRPVASVLVRIARRGKSPRFDSLLDTESGSLSRQVFAEVWRETIVCVWRNVQKGRFKAKGSLLAYLVKIAVRRTIDLGRNQCNSGDSDVMENLADNPTERPDGLLEDVERFYTSLPEKDREILRLGVKLAQEYDSWPKMRKEFLVRLAVIYEDKGWPISSAVASVRKLNRLRQRLREYLRKRGHNV